MEDIRGERLANILTILNSAITHGLDPRQYPIVVTEGMLNLPFQQLRPTRRRAAGSLSSDGECRRKERAMDGESLAELSVEALGLLSTLLGAGGLQ